MTTFKKEKIEIFNKNIFCVHYLIKSNNEIIELKYDKADDFRVYLGDEFVNLDVLQCKINAAE